MGTKNIYGTGKYQFFRWQLVPHDMTKISQDCFDILEVPIMNIYVMLTKREYIFSCHCTFVLLVQYYKITTCIYILFISVWWCKQSPSHSSIADRKHLLCSEQLCMTSIGRCSRAIANSFEVVWLTLWSLLLMHTAGRRVAMAAYCTRKILLKNHFWTSVAVYGPKKSLLQ